MPVSRRIGPSGSGSEGQLIGGGAVGAARPPAGACGAGCCARPAIPTRTMVKTTESGKIEPRILISHFSRRALRIEGTGTLANLDQIEFWSHRGAGRNGHRVCAVRE